MVGESVVHARFGRGRVSAFEPPRIEIAFEDGSVRTFAYPLSAGRFFRFESEDARQRAESDQAQSEEIARRQAVERLQMERQRAEEAARRRVEELHDKRVAAARRTAARSAAARKQKSEAR